MRPIKLTMENFGSYAKKTTIDFRTLSKDGVFLITGDTGSGKTTIFDAICYALYDKANGSDRKNTQLRSDYALPDEKVSVTLVFECHGKEYTIIREAGETTRNKKGDPKTDKKIELHLPDGTVQTESKKVKECIDSIIGLGDKQFRRVVMLAQGEFKAFLLASSREKSEILRDIFCTEQYDKFIAKLDYLKNDYAEKYKNAFNEISVQVMGLDYDDDWEYAKKFEEWKSKEAKDKSIEVVLPHIGDYLEELKAQRDTLDADKESALQKRDELEVKIDFHNNINAWIKKRDDDKMKLNELEGKSLEICEKEDCIKNIKDAKDIKVLYEKFKTLEEQGIKTGKIVDSKHSQVLECEKEIESTYSNLHELLDSSPYELDGNIDTVDKQLSDIKNDLEVEKTDWEKELEFTKDVIASISQYDKEVSALEEQRKTQSKRTDEKYRLEKEYAESERLYSKNILGTLAEELDEGLPCPLCGATHHPKLAVRDIEAPDEEQLRRLKLELKDYQQCYEKYQEEFVKQEQRVESLKQQILTLIDEILYIFDDDIPIEAFDIDVSMRQDLIKVVECDRKEIEEKRVEIKRLEEYQTSVESLEDELVRLENSLKVLMAEESTIHGQLEQRRDEYRSVRDLLRKAMKEKGFASEEHYLKVIADEGKLSALESEVAEYKSSIDIIKSNINDAVKIIKDNEYYDTTELTLKKDMENSKANEIVRKLTTIENRIEKDEKVYAEMRAKSGDVSQKYKLSRDAEMVHKCATGTNSAGSDISSKDSFKVAFNSYVQSYYFDKVLDTANKKLQVMSNYRYTLINKNKDSKRGSSGLDISVYDVHTGKCREATTLSGGETFEASLSLALGLSEVMQQLSGGIKIDSMFIDEGFGTLDNGESLQSAIDVISNLATGDRMVGIISHVSELKASIPNQLKVVKTKEGSEIVAD